MNGEVELKDLIDVKVRDPKLGEFEEKWSDISKYGEPPILQLMKKLKLLLPGHVIGKVDFSKTDKVYDWRNHVPEELIEIWDTLTEGEKKVIYIMAERLASKEEWN